MNVLMTGAGAPGAPGIIHCLKQEERIRLTVSDANETATGRYLAPVFIRIPRADDPAFIPELLGLCQRERIDCLLPLVTRELELLARHRSDFAAIGTTVLVSDIDALSIANDKAACYRFLKDKGIGVPDFRLADTVEQFVHAAFELGHPHQSFVFKPARSNGSRGVRIVSESLNESDLLFNHKPYHLHITYTHALEILSARPFPPLLISAYLPGDEFSIDCLADHGKPVLVVPRRRLRMVNGISVQGEFVRDEAIISYCSTIISALGLHGNIGLQVKLDGEGRPLLLEINPRVQGTIVAALGAGVNLPLLAIKQAMKLSITPGELDIRWGTRFSRYWTEAFY